MRGAQHANQAFAELDRGHARLWEKGQKVTQNRAIQIAIISLKRSDSRNSSSCSRE